MIWKALTVCLVLANVCYFLWARDIARVPESAAGPPPATLKLASEVGNNAGLAAAHVAESTPGGTEAVPAAPLAEDAPRPGTNAAVLLTNVRRCVSVGPFRDVSETARAASTLRGGGYDPRQRVAEGEVWAGVWVYLPLPSARPAVEQALAKLKAAGIDDALEMPGPAEGSVISLGLFSEPKRAQSRVAQAQALGFNPGIADRKRSGNVFWIDIDLKPTDALLNPSDLKSESGRIVRLEVKACPTAAGVS